MIIKHVIQHLRIHFSFFLLPVFLFALSQANNINTPTVMLCFFILHFLIYPSSNGYNGYMDQDKGSIGGLENPPEAPRLLLHVSLMMDAIGLILALFISIEVAIMILAYILASRAYSSRKIRLKKRPFISYITVIVFQGAVIYLITSIACTGNTLIELMTDNTVILPTIISSLIIGAGYPLTQVYQHKQDIEDGVKTISYVLGIKNTFYFSGFMLSIAIAGLFMHFNATEKLSYFYLFLIFSLPTTFWFSKWFLKVNKDLTEANFKNTMQMNLISAIAMNAYFLTLFILEHMSL